jgi:cobalamin biosynthesis protein CbiD
LHSRNYGSLEFSHANAENTGGATVNGGAADHIDMTQGGTIVSQASISGTTVTCTSV